MSRNLKANIEIGDANNLLHSLAAVLDEESKDSFYDAMQWSRNTGNPQKIVEAVLANILLLLSEEVKKCAEKNQSN